MTIHNQFIRSSYLSILTPYKALTFLERNFANSTSLGTFDNGNEFSAVNDKRKASVLGVQSLTETIGLEIG